MCLNLPRCKTVVKIFFRNEGKDGISRKIKNIKYLFSFGYENLDFKVKLEDFL